MTLLLILLFSVLGSVGSALVASLLFIRRSRPPEGFKSAVLSYATGTMLGAALLGMPPRVSSTSRWSISPRPTGPGSACMTPWFKASGSPPGSPRSGR